MAGELLIDIDPHLLVIDKERDQRRLTALLAYLTQVHQILGKTLHPQQLRSLVELDLSRIQGRANIPDVYTYKDMSVSVRNREFNGRYAKNLLLGNSGMSLLTYLMRHPEQIVPSERLVEVLGYTGLNATHSLSRTVCRTRTLIGDYLVMQRNVGVDESWYYIQSFSDNNPDSKKNANGYRLKVFPDGT